MNTKLLRMKNSKKGITPVIATIILIAVTLVLALVVGAYTFGLFGSNVKTIQLTSGILNSGAATLVSTTAACTGANFQLTFNNPGGSTYIQSITVSAGGQALSLTYLQSGATSCTDVTSTFSSTFQIGTGSGKQAVVYFGTSPLNSGSTYSYVITFTNGQSITGSLIAQ